MKNGIADEMDEYFLQGSAKSRARRAIPYDLKSHNGFYVIKYQANGSQF
jgi:hypothetical protein